MFDFTIILGAKEYLHICNIGTFVGLPFLSNLEVFVFWKISHFLQKKIAFGIFWKFFEKIIWVLITGWQTEKKHIEKENFWRFLKRIFKIMPHTKKIFSNLKLLFRPKNSHFLQNYFFFKKSHFFDMDAWWDFFNWLRNLWFFNRICHVWR